MSFYTGDRLGAWQGNAALVELGLLDKSDGELTAPFDEIVIHAVVRDAA